MAGFIFKLQTIVSAPPQMTSTDVQIAKLLLKNISKIEREMSIKQLADMCYTSVSSMSRFANNIGYENFNQMKNDYIGIKYEEFKDLKIDNSHLDKMDVNTYKRNIIEGLENFDNLEKLGERLSKYIMDYDSICILSTHIPNNIMSILHRGLLAMGKHVDFIVDRHMQIEKTKHAQKDELFIMVSLDGSYAMDRDVMIPFITSDSKKLLITQNEHMKFSREFDEVFQLGSVDEEFVSKYKLLLFVEYLIHYIYTNYDS